MPILALTTPSHTEVQPLAEALATACRCRQVTDSEILQMTGEKKDVDPRLLSLVVQGHSIPFNNFTHEREKVIAALNRTLVDLIRTGNCIFIGLLGHLIPGFAAHVLRILFTAEPETRIAKAARSEGIDVQKAAKLVAQADRLSEEWVAQLTNRSLWDPALYHLVINTQALPTPETGMAIQKILQYLDQNPFSDTCPRDAELADLEIWANVHEAVAHLGNGLLVTSAQGHVVVTLDRKRMNLPKTQTEIMTAVTAIPGVVSVKTRIGPNYYKSEMIKNFDFSRSTGRSLWDTSKQTKK